MTISDDINDIDDNIGDINDVEDNLDDINDVEENIDDDLDDDTGQGSLDQAKPCEEGRQDGCQVQVIQVIINIIIIDDALFHSIPVKFTFMVKTLFDESPKKWSHLTTFWASLT